MNGRQKLATLEPLRTHNEKLMRTFRMPRELVFFLKDEAARTGRDLTAHVIRWLEGIRTYFGLPEAAKALLEADRSSIGMERYEYLLHTLYQRSLELRERGAGFDAPGPGGRTRSDAEDPRPGLLPEPELRKAP